MNALKTAKLALAFAGVTGVTGCAGAIRNERFNECLTRARIGDAPAAWRPSIIDACERATDSGRTYYRYYP